jgi:hypothetical protein
MTGSLERRSLANRSPTPPTQRKDRPTARTTHRPRTPASLNFKPFISLERAPPSVIKRGFLSEVRPKVKLLAQKLLFFSI